MPFLSILNCKLRSPRCPVHFLSATFPDRGPQPRKQRSYILRRPRKSHFTTEKIGFRSESVFTRNSYASDLLHFQLLDDDDDDDDGDGDGDGDDVVDMMMG